MQDARRYCHDLIYICHYQLWACMTISDLHHHCWCHGNFRSCYQPHFFQIKERPWTQVNVSRVLIVFWYLPCPDLPSNLWSVKSWQLPSDRSQSTHLHSFHVLNSVLLFPTTCLLHFSLGVVGIFLFALTFAVKFLHIIILKPLLICLHIYQRCLYYIYTVYCMEVLSLFLHGLWAH